MSFNNLRHWQIILTLLLIDSSPLIVSSPRSISLHPRPTFILWITNNNNSKWWCSRQSFLLVIILKEYGQMQVVWVQLLCMDCRNKFVKFLHPCITVDLHLQTFRCCLNNFHSSIYTNQPTNNLSPSVVTDSYKNNLNTCIVVACSTYQGKELRSTLQLHKILAKSTW